MKVGIKKLKNKAILILITILFIALILICNRIICKKWLYPTKYNRHVQNASTKYNVDPYLMFAIIKQESNFDNNVVSRKDAKGLMQLLDSTAKEVSEDIKEIDSNNLDLFDPCCNITIGIKYFKSLVERYNGNINLAICAYNAGLGNVDRWIQSKDIFLNGHIIISNIPFEETKNYLISVLNYYDKYIKLYCN